MPAAIYTIGHSNHSIDRFVALLHTAEIDCVVDVRSVPHSRRFPQFGKARLSEALTGAGISYRFAGDALGGRPQDTNLWRDGRPDYPRMIVTASARDALADIQRMAAQHRVCLMCSEKEPLDCHRCLMVARALAARGSEVLHILADGRRESQPEAEARLLTWANRRQPELFQSAAERLAAAYEARADWLWKTGPSRTARKM